MGSTAQASEFMLLGWSGYILKLAKIVKKILQHKLNGWFY